MCGRRPKKYATDVHRNIHIERSVLSVNSLAVIVIIPILLILVILVDLRILENTKKQGVQ